MEKVTSKGEMFLVCYVITKINFTNSADTGNYICQIPVLIKMCWFAQSPQSQIRIWTKLKVFMKHWS